MNYNASRGGAIRNWVRDYNKYGEMIFYNKPHNKSYSAELKREAVESYLNGEGSMDDICLRYEIYSASILRRCIKKHNANRELKDYDPKREVYMAEARRKTTIEERKEIVEYCLNHERNYKDTASQYQPGVFLGKEI